MSLSLGNITFDCDDPQKVAAFWAAAHHQYMPGHPVRRVRGQVDRGGAEVLVAAEAAERDGFGE